MSAEARLSARVVAPVAAPAATPTPGRVPTPPVKTATPARKATNKEKKERDELPKRIEALETEQKQLAAAVAAPDFYKQPAAEITATMARLEAVPGELLAAYARWDELEGLK